ncbi:uncharacterized protein (TIGR02679 family) [Halopolyspora algeriensis]|uniref:Uncharacterized protein (TIGR02679 family) n=1 Tax=Halopolyspora algeriensis TaxID=1500506 RepID=A0A368VHI1_9ACTN|nr:TIGR02679 family protein [Halopolyspora algeriensis]RCW39655.1 uncharacterized protein (TIGR02679 family) [Halopolyspora algeriensis]TQM54052.1 uncharacterized protein (TIGR02679 family) [Halopolyspora algeriensis]
MDREGLGELTLPEELRRAELAPLWREVHRRLSSGRAVTRLRVGPMDDEQRFALADLLGLDRLPERHHSLPLSRLESVVADACGCSVTEVVTELLGPLADRAGDRDRERAARQRLWEWLGEHEVVTAQPALYDWVEQMRRNGVLDGSVTATRAVLSEALRVLERLPAEGTPLPALATETLGDPHALDGGTRRSGIVLRALACLYGVAPPDGAEQRRALWERAGVSEDELSASVLAAGLWPSGDGVACRVLRVCAESGEAAALTLAQLRQSVAVPEPDVWVVENPTVLTLALRRFGTACPPMICTSGWPNSAAIRLLRGLAETGTALHYHGDFDGEGVRIAAHVLAKAGAVPWRMSAADYLEALPDGAAPSVGRVTEAPWDGELAAAMRGHGISVPEEQVAQRLLNELGPRRGQEY